MTTQASIAAQPGWKPYLDIARVDHWFKQVFMLVGSAVALVLADVSFSDAVVPTLIALLSTSLLASANYTINEFLDAQSDHYHPTKKHRASVTGKVKRSFVIVEYVVLAAAGLFMASRLPPTFLALSITFLVLGAAYNVPPIRTKDIPYLDVAWESLTAAISDFEPMSTRNYSSAHCWCLKEGIWRWAASQRRSRPT